MNFKKLLIITASVILSVCAFAQGEQVGYVKTRGRLVDGKHVPGKGLPGALISVQGRNKMLVQNEDGSFSFPVTDRSYTVQSVTLSDYVMVDSDALPRTYEFSSNPLYLVLAQPDELQYEQYEIQWKLREVLERQLQEKIREIEELKLQNKISQEEYRANRLKLMEVYGNEEKLVKEMAKRYSEIDYDQIDEFYRQVSSYIVEGELSRADSLLKSRGDIHQQIKKHIDDGEAIHVKEEELAKAKLVHQHEREEMAQRCYSYHESFHLQHQLDSAAHYIQLRAGLDTTNVDWQNAAGDYLLKYCADYELADHYYLAAWKIVLENYGEEHPYNAQMHERFGDLYYAQEKTTIAFDFYLQSFEIYKAYYGEAHPDMASIYVAVGNISADGGMYSQAMECFTISKDLYVSIYGESHPSVADVYINMSTVYAKQKDYDKAFYYYEQALEIYRSFYGESDPSVANAYAGIGLIYSKTGNYNHALDYYNQALEMMMLIYPANHPQIATLYSNIGEVYENTGDYTKALEYYEKTLKMRKSFYGDFTYKTLASYNNLGSLYYFLGNIENALGYFNETLRIAKSIDGYVYDLKVEIASVSASIGMIYYYQDSYQQALDYLTEAINLYKSKHGDTNPYIANLYNNIAAVYSKQGNHAIALDYFNKALTILKSLENPEYDDLILSIERNIGIAKSKSDKKD